MITFWGKNKQFLKKKTEKIFYLPMSVLNSLLRIVAQKRVLYRYTSILLPLTKKKTDNFKKAMTISVF